MSKSEKIYEGITGIRDDIIEDARSYEFSVGVDVGASRPRATKTSYGHKGGGWMKWLALAASVCLVVSVGIGVWHMIVRPTSGRKIMYSAYDGPILPLAASNDVTGVEVKRHINLDLSEFGNAEYMPHSQVTDSYVLTNTTDNDVVMKAVYGFAGNLEYDVSCIPEVTVNGQRVETALWAGYGDYEDYSADKSEVLESFENYESALADGKYMNNALGVPLAYTNKVTVYKISGAERSEDGKAQDVAIWYSMDSTKTKVFHYGFVSRDVDAQNNRYCLRAYMSDEHDVERGKDRYVIVVGEDIQISDVLCINVGAEGDGVSADGQHMVAKYEAAVGDVLQEIGSQLVRFNGKAYKEHPLIHTQMTGKAMALALLQVMVDFGAFDLSVNSDMYNSIEEFEHIVYSAQRVMYVTWEVTIPAGQSVDVVASMKKPGKILSGDKDNRYDGYTDCYDVMTKLGSNLCYTEQTASISGADSVNIAEQNFGFDVKNAITKVKLNLDEPRYYIRIKN